jgi:DNA polymerase-3 subunit epsilon
MKFAAFDVETANADYSSICQIGFVEFDQGEIIDSWKTLVNPEAFFDPMNVSIHGISREDVIDAPTFDSIFPELKKRLEQNVVVHHMPFDRIAVERAAREYELDPPDVSWLDSAKVTRRTWEEFRNRGYGLKNVARFLGYEFEHHDALEDAKAAGEIVKAACETSGLSIEEWLVRVNGPLVLKEGGSAKSSYVNLSGNIEGSLYGETLVFTGSLSLVRSEAAEIAARLGCNVTNSVSKKTTILVVGLQDESRLAGYEKSSKHRKAEELIAKGSDIKILSELDFIEICNREGEVVSPKTIKPKSTGKKKEAKPRGERSITITLDDESLKKLGDDIEEMLEAVPEEVKEQWKRENQEHEALLASIKDCSPEKKKEIGRSISKEVSKLAQLAQDNSGNILAETVENAAENVEEVVFDLIKNKTDLRTVYEVLEDSASFLEDDMEHEWEGEAPRFCSEALSLLERLKLKVRESSMKEGS